MGPKMLCVTTFVSVIALAALLQTAQAETHTVSWTNSLGAAYYTSFAANHTFKVGDVLVFNFTTGRHDVAEVSKDAYGKCNVTDFIGTPKTAGPANYTLSSTGDHYFICLFLGHCDQGGQKLTIAVTSGASAPTPVAAPKSSSTPSPSSKVPSTPGTSSPTAPPPAGSSGSSAHVVTISSVLMSIAIALFCLF